MSSSEIDENAIVKVEDMLHSLCIEVWSYTHAYSSYPLHIHAILTASLDMYPEHKRSEQLKMRLQLNELLRLFVTKDVFTSSYQEDIFQQLFDLFNKPHRDVELNNINVLTDNMNICIENVNNWRILTNTDTGTLHNIDVYEKFIEQLLDLLVNLELEDDYLISEKMTLEQYKLVLERNPDFWKFIKHRLNDLFCISLKLLHYRLPMPLILMTEKCLRRENDQSYLASIIPTIDSDKQSDNCLPDALMTEVETIIDSDVQSSINQSDYSIIEEQSPQKPNQIESDESTIDPANLSDSSITEEEIDTASDRQSDIVQTDSLSEEQHPQKKMKIGNEHIQSVNKSRRRDGNFRLSTKPQTFKISRPLLFEDSDDDAIFGAPTSVKSEPLRSRRTWSNQEMKSLVEGVKRYGVGRWATIKEDPRYTLSHRTNVQLKDKWRNMCDKDCALKRIF